MGSTRHNFLYIASRRCVTYKYGCSLLNQYIFDIHALILFFCFFQYFKVSKGEKIRNQYNQVPHLTQNTDGKVTNSQLDTTNESQEVSPFPAGNHKAQINRRTQRRNKHKTEKTKMIHKRSTTLERLVKIFYWRA